MLLFGHELDDIKEKIAYKIAAFKKAEIDIDALKKRLDVEKWVSEGFEFTSKIDKTTEKRECIVIGLLHCEETSYNMIHSLYEAFETDSQCKPIVILQGKGYGNQYKEIEKQIKEKGMRYEFDYNCRDEEFDVLVVHHVQLPPTEDIKKIISHSTLKVAVPVGVISYGGSGISENDIKNYSATEVFLERTIFERTPQRVRDIFNCYTTGNPKFDCIFNAYHHKYVIPSQFEKLKSSKIKKVILWTTDHNGGFQLCSQDVAFDLYAESVFRYMEKHRDIGLIFRPYRTYVQELLRDGLWTEEQIEYLKNYCSVTENIVWDDEPDYSVSYSLADAILADAGCGIICSALPMMKPIGITLRWDMDMSIILRRNREILDAHYLISSEEEMYSFIEMIKEERDPGIIQRKKLCEKYVTHFDGKNGERIKNIIIQKLREVRTTI